MSLESVRAFFAENAPDISVIESEMIDADKRNFLGAVVDDQSPSLGRIVYSG
jgi:hypothetical protein